MTSLELVEFINSQRADGEPELRHDHFMAKVPKVLGETAAPNFRDSYVGRDGTTRPCYRFPKREACLMAMSYSYELQAAVFDRMTQLEQVANDPRIPKTYGDALRLAADQAEEIARKDAELAAAAPKLAALERIAASDKSHTLTEAAKVLGVKREKLASWMHANGWVYRQNESWVAYQAHITSGDLEYKEANYTDEKTGMKCARPYCHILPKGLTKLAEAFERLQAH